MKTHHDVDCFRSLVFANVTPVTSTESSSETSGEPSLVSCAMLEQAVYLFLTEYKPRNLPFTFIDSRGIAISSKLVFLSESRAASLRPLFEADLGDLLVCTRTIYSPPTIGNLKDQRRPGGDGCISGKISWMMCQSSVPMANYRRHSKAYTTAAAPARH